MGFPQDIVGTGALRGEAQTDLEGKEGRTTGALETQQIAQTGGTRQTGTV